MLSGFKDQVFGGHVDGDMLTLSDEFGGGRYRVVAMDQEALGKIGEGELHVVFQLFSFAGRMKGRPLITVDQVDREVAEKILRGPADTPSVHVYTPSREDAVAMMSGLGWEPIERSSSFFLDSVNLRNICRAQGEAVPGPVCLFGSILTRQEGEGAPEWELDANLGFHGLGADAMKLAADLGGWEFHAADADEARLDAVEEGEGRLLIDLAQMRKALRGIKPEGICLSVENAPRDVLIRVSRDKSRLGVLSAFVPSREDAEALLREADGEVRIFHSKASCDGLTVPYAECRVGGHRIRAFYRKRCRDAQSQFSNWLS